MNDALPRGSGPNQLRWLNVAAVLGALRVTGVARVADLVAGTRLTRPTVTQALAVLERAGWVVNVADGQPATPPRTSPPAPPRVPPPARRLGRPAQLVRFRAEAGHVLGMEISPHGTSVVVADLAGTVLAQWRGPDRRSGTGRDLIADLTTAVRTALTTAAVAPESVLGAAVGTPGIVADGQVQLSPSMPGWAGLPLRTELARMLDCPVSVDNDVNLAVLAERWLGGHQPEPTGTLVLVHWGPRLGAGFMIGDRVHRGASAAAGEIGFLDLAAGRGPDRGARVLGAFEATVGFDAIAALVRDALAGAAGERTEHPADVSTLFESATAGDPAALTVVDQVAQRFAQGLAPVLLMLDPDLVVIGGGLIASGGPAGGHLLLDAIGRHLRDRTVVPANLAFSKLGDSAVALGAVQWALEEVRERHFSAAAFARTA